MLKTRRGEQAWLVTQPAHADLAGQLAAHWGNDEFTRVGEFGDITDPSRVRHEVVLAVAEHDNGWWEWEADPSTSEDDGLPSGLGEVIANPAAGMARWRLGIPRLAERHPYASLLIADHAAWLYRAQFDPDHAAELTHPLQADRRLYPAEQRETVAEFLADVAQLEHELVARLEADPFWRAAVVPEVRLPHSRLLQTLDALSLALCSNVLPSVDGPVRGLGEDHVVLGDVPRHEWSDRVSLDVTPRADRHLRIRPYPFDDAPLHVRVPARLVLPHADWRAVAPTLLTFTLESQ